LCCTFICLDKQIDEQTFLHMPESMIKKEIIPMIEKRFYFLKNRKTLLENENENLTLVR